MTLKEIFPEMPKDTRSKAGLIVAKKFNSIGLKDEFIFINGKKVIFKSREYSEEDLPGIVSCVAQNFKL